MKIFKKQRVWAAALVVTGISGAWAKSANATVIGPGVAPFSILDLATNTSIELANPATLSPGTYNLDSFTAHIGQAGDVEPILAIIASGTAGSGNETYQIIAVGTDRTYASAVGTTTVAFGGVSPTFTVPAGPGQTIYAGDSSFSPGGVAPVTSNGGPVSTPGSVAVFTNSSPSTVGQTIAEYGAAGGSGTNGGSNGAATGTTGSGASYELARTFDYSISISPAPEPTSLGLLGLAALGCLARRRRT